MITVMPLRLRRLIIDPRDYHVAAVADAAMLSPDYSHMLDYAYYRLSSRSTED